MILLYLPYSNCSLYAFCRKRCVKESRHCCHSSSLSRSLPPLLPSSLLVNRKPTTKCSIVEKRRTYGETNKTNQIQPNPSSIKPILSSSSRYHHNHHHHHPIPVFINPTPHTRSLTHSLTSRETTSTRTVASGQRGPFCIQGHICFGPFQPPYLVQQPERDVVERENIVP